MKQNKRTFYRMITPPSFADTNYTTLGKAIKARRDLVKNVNDQYKDYWSNIAARTKIVKVTEITEDIC